MAVAYLPEMTQRVETARILKFSDTAAVVDLSSPGGFGIYCTHIHNTNRSHELVSKNCRIAEGRP